MIAQGLARTEAAPRQPPADYDGTMATWKDGAAYAPVERPDGFATPVAEPLSAAVTAPAVTPGAVTRPQRLDAVDAPPLAGLGRSDVRTRNPQEPFDVATATMMSAPRLADGNRDPKAPFSVTTAASDESKLPPPPPGSEPLRLAPPETGSPSSQPSFDDPSVIRRTFGLVFALVCAVGILVPATTPLALTLTGTIAFLRLPAFKKVTIGVLGSGAVLLILQLLVPDSQTDTLFRFGATVASVTFLVIVVLKDDSSNPPPPGYGGGPGAPPPGR